MIVEFKQKPAVDFPRIAMTGRVRSERWDDLIASLSDGSAALVDVPEDTDGRNYQMLVAAALRHRNVHVATRRQMSNGRANTVHCQLLQQIRNPPGMVGAH